MSINNPDLLAIFNRVPQEKQISENPFKKALTRIEQNPQPQSEKTKQEWINSFKKIIENNSIQISDKKEQILHLVRLSLRLKIFTEDELTTELKNIGIERKKPTTSTDLATYTFDEIHTQDITNKAANRKKLLDEIHRFKAFISDQNSGGIMGAFAAEAKQQFPLLIEQYATQYDKEDLTPGDSLDEFILTIPSEIGERFDAHGIKSGKSFNSLINLLTNGVNPDKSFYSMNLNSNIEAASAIGASHPYTDGGIIVVGPVNKNRSQTSEEKHLIFNSEKKETDIRYVILDRQFFFAIPELQKAFPNVMFLKSTEATKILTQEVKKIDSTTN